MNCAVSMLITAGVKLAYSELEAIVFAPLLHDLDEVLNLGIGSVFEHLDDFNEALFVLCARDHQLEHTDGGSTLSFPELGVCV